MTKWFLAPDFDQNAHEACLMLSCVRVCNHVQSICSFQLFPDDADLHCVSWYHCVEGSSMVSSAEE